MAATSSVAPAATAAGASTPAEVKGPQTTFVLITPDGYMSKDDIKRRFKEEKFTIVRERTARLTVKQAEALLVDYKTRADAAAFSGLANFISTNQVVGLEIRAENAVAAVKAVGAQLTELYGTPAKPFHVALYCSNSEEAAAKELDTIFQSTFAMIKPDAYPRREEIKAILSGLGFNIVREISFTLTKDAANMFYAEHAEKKWFPDFANFMTSGPVLAMELNEVTAVAAWRALCGPTSTEQAQKEAPASLRAKFGTAGNPNANAVHGSDSAESARRELDLVFNWFQSNTYAMVKPDASARVEEIKKRIIDAGFEIVQEREVKRLPADTVQQFYAEHAEKKWFPEFAAFMTSGPVVGFELKATNAIKRWRALCGPTSVESAVKDAPDSLRAKFGTLGNSNKNAVHGSDSPDAARREIDLIFQDTFAMVKPDAVAAGHVDAIKARITADGFEIVRSQNLRLNKDQAAQFYAEHKDRAWFPDFSAFMTSGEVHIMQLRRTNAVRAWRALCGPTSVKTALKDAPNSLRALYGNPENANANAVHGSDAATSAQREIALMFEDFCGPKKPKGMVATADVDSADPMDFL